MRAEIINLNSQFRFKEVVLRGYVDISATIFLHSEELENRLERSLMF